MSNSNIGAVPLSLHPLTVQPHIVTMPEEDPAFLNAEHRPLLGTESVFAQTNQDGRLAMAQLRRKNTIDLVYIGLAVSNAVIFMTTGILGLLDSDKALPTFGVFLVFFIAYAYVGSLRTRQ